MSSSSTALSCIPRLGRDHRAVAVDNRARADDARLSSGPTVGRIQDFSHGMGNGQLDVKGERVPWVRECDSGRRVEPGFPNAVAGSGEIGYEERGRVEVRPVDCGSTVDGERRRLRLEKVR